MTDTIKKVDSDHIVVVSTSTSEQLIAKKTLEAQRQAEIDRHTAALADIDAKLAYFTA